jgi:hypothetical protein
MRLGLIGGAGPLAQREQKRTLFGLEPRRHTLGHEPRLPIPPRIVTRAPGECLTHDEEYNHQNAQRSEDLHFTRHRKAAYRNRASQAICVARYPGRLAKDVQAWLNPVGWETTTGCENCCAWCSDACTAPRLFGVCHRQATPRGVQAPRSHMAIGTDVNAPHKAGTAQTAVALRQDIACAPI